LLEMRNSCLQSDKQCSIYVQSGVLLCSPDRLFDIVKSHESADARRASSAGGRVAKWRRSGHSLRAFAAAMHPASLTHSSSRRKPGSPFLSSGAGKKGDSSFRWNDGMGSLE
jgi:hypothetical protein